MKRRVQSLGDEKEKASNKGTGKPWGQAGSGENIDTISPQYAESTGGGDVLLCVRLDAEVRDFHTSRPRK